MQTEAGQRLDQAAFAGGTQTPQRAQDAAGNLLRTVSVGGLAISILLLGCVAALRRRPGLVLVPAISIGATMIGVEAFKHAILDRPELLDVPAFTENTYPSGHTAVAISTGLAALLVAPPRFRPAVAALAALWAAGFGVLVVTAEWHLPSDALGSYAFALAVAAAVMAAVYALSPATLAREREAQAWLPPADHAASRLELAGLGAGVAFFFGVILFASLRYGPEIDWTRFDAAYLGAMAAIVFAAALTVSSLLRAVSGQALPRRGRRDTVSAAPGSRLQPPAGRARSGPDRGETT